MTVAQAIAAARATLLGGGIPADEAPGDAEVLARHVLGWDLARLAASFRDNPPPDFQSGYDALIARRLRREPVSQIVGHREFWGLDFEVTRDVLTPRPETEFAVQAVLDVAPEAATIVDIGTGSGCIAIALATERPGARIVATDASLAALEVARRNAARHGVGSRIAFRHTDAIPPEMNVDIVVSNPPYIPLSQRNALPPEVRDHEPDLALFGGTDGLEFYRALFERLQGSFSPRGGWLVVEVGYDQAAAVRALADRRYWEAGRTYRDLQGIERVLTFSARPEDHHA